MINTGLSYGIHWLSLEPVAFIETFANTEAIFSSLMIIPFPGIDPVSQVPGFTTIQRLVN